MTLELGHGGEHVQHQPPGGAARVKVYSSVDTGFYRIYRWDLLAEVVKSAALGLDRVKNYKFNANISDYANVFATAELIAITSQPMYVRNVWLP